MISISVVLCLFSLMVQAKDRKADTLLVAEDEIILVEDTAQPVVLVDSVWKPNPKKATLLSAAFPGVGQIYNRQWWKAPIIYAGMGTLGYFIYWNNDSYNLYRNGYLDYIDDDPTTRRYNLIPGAENVNEEEQSSWFETTLENRTNSFRRNRDLIIISTIGVYVLNIIEANVAAHLKDFDVSDDLSLKVAPSFDYNMAYNEPVFGVSLTLNLK